MRHRKLPESNYSSIFINGKTLRIPLDAKKPITELAWPEFYDISAGNRCATGKCDFCYASGSKTGKHYTNIVDKIDRFFGKMSTNQRPLQVAIGGEQEPLEHPDFWEMVKKFEELGIVANYTTNGVLINEKNIELTLRHCGGVAVTLHPHLEKHWKRALKNLGEYKVRCNIHFIVSDAQSVEQLKTLYKEYADNNVVEYFVLLPYMPYGFAKNVPKNIDYDAFEGWVDSIYTEGRLAFGANFYNFLRKHSKKYNVSLYSPEIFSKYVILDDKMFTDTGAIIYNNSFDKEPVKFDFESGCEIGKVRTDFLAVN
jgi:sulfatase maturation enzyme AslB (radical SAM superfamily)